MSNISPDGVRELYVSYFCVIYLIPGKFRMLPMTGIRRINEITTGKNPENNTKKP